MLAAALVSSHSSSALGQSPVCAPPSPADQYYTACVSGGRFLAARLLFELAVDHQMKSDTDPVLRRADDLLRTAVSKEVRERNGALLEYLGKLAPLTFSKLDTTTGNFELVVTEDLRRFDGPVDVDTDRTEIAWQLPARLVGGYWRTPAALQIAFWEGRRAHVAIPILGGTDLEADIECIAVSTDGIRIVTHGSDTPDLLVRFDECG